MNTPYIKIIYDDKHIASMPLGSIILAKGQRLNFSLANSNPYIKGNNLSGIYEINDIKYFFLDGVLIVIEVTVTNETESSELS